MAAYAYATANAYPSTSTSTNAYDQPYFASSSTSLAAPGSSNASNSGSASGRVSGETSRAPSSMRSVGTGSPLDNLVRRTSSRRMREGARAQQDREKEQEGQRYAQQREQQQQHQYDYSYSSQQQQVIPRIAVQTYDAHARDTVASEDDYAYNYDDYYGDDAEADGIGGLAGVARTTSGAEDADAAYDYNHTQEPRPGSASGPQLAQYAYSHRPRAPSAQPAATSTTDYNVTTERGPLRIAITPSPDTNYNNDMRSNAPPSPLLHSHFARDSVGTASEFGARSRTSSQSSAARSQISGRSTYTSDYLGVGRFGSISEDEDGRSSVYSGETELQGPALRDSWRSTGTGGTVRGPDDYFMQSNAASLGGPRTPAELVEKEVRPGLAVREAQASFSRPAALEGHPAHAEAMGERVTVQLPAEMREGKKKVLERNAPRREAEPTAPSSLRPEIARTTTPASALYSQYSYYSYQSPVPSPLDGEFAAKRATTPTGKSVAFAPSPTPLGPTTPEEYLQLGIQHHEANRLQESARCFERSAIEGGGCGVGMLMYGLTLRHGWGCRKNEAMGFKWLMKAAEYAVGDLERVRTGGFDAELGSVQSELVLAIYEVGQCFFHGWGVAKDQKMGVSYYGVAARLGDGDAQNDLAFCLANGKGCKKDKKTAAMWYRAAVGQGQSDVGLAWIYKDKYQ